MQLKYAVAVAVVMSLAFDASICAAAQVDPCSLLTQAQVSAAVGVAVANGRPFTSRGCEWDAPAPKPGDSQKKVYVTLMSDREFANAKLPVGGAITKTAASGIGDEAVFGTTGKLAASLSVRKGSVMFSVNLRGFPLAQPVEVSDVQAKEKAIALQIVPKL